MRGTLCSINRLIIRICCVQKTERHCVHVVEECQNLLSQQAVLFTYHCEESLPTSTALTGINLQGNEIVHA